MQQTVQSNMEHEQIDNLENTLETPSPVVQTTNSNPTTENDTPPQHDDLVLDKNPTNPTQKNENLPLLSDQTTICNTIPFTSQSANPSTSLVAATSQLSPNFLDRFKHKSSYQKHTHVKPEILQLTPGTPSKDNNISKLEKQIVQVDDESSEKQKTKVITPVMRAAQTRRQQILNRIDEALAAWCPTMHKHIELCTRTNGSQSEEPDSFSKQIYSQASTKSPVKTPTSTNKRRMLSNDNSPSLKKRPRYETNSNVLDVGKLDEEDSDQWDGLTFPEQVQNLDLDHYQQAAVDAAIQGQSFFLTGSAGTGKSFVLRRIIQEKRAMGSRVAVTASTGCAAVALQGNTVHSVSGVGLGKDNFQRLRKKARSRPLQNRLREIDVLVIDEISMIDSFLLDKIEFMFKCARGPENASKSKTQDTGDEKKRKSKANSSKFDPDAPFGGVQVIFCGDFFQLPPVGASDNRLMYSKDKFFAFESDTWKKTVKNSFVLRVVHRQNDNHFVGLLDEMRRGFVSEHTIRVLKACYVPVGQAGLEVNEDGDHVEFTKLFAYRAEVDRENISQLKMIKRPGIRYKAMTFYDRDKFEQLPEAAIKSLVDNLNAPQEVELKEGARILCLKNVDTSFGIVNGAGGQVIGFCLPHDDLVAERRKRHKSLSTEEIALKKQMGTTLDGLLFEEILRLDDPRIQSALKKLRRKVMPSGLNELDAMQDSVHPVVRFDNGIVRTMIPQSWDVYGMSGQIVATRRQVPLMLGWALSTHKSQGMTLGNVEADVGKAFDYGQVYVALSRATSIRELRLRSFARSKVISHTKVRQFYDNLGA